jgi:hypothetical protein
MVGMIRLSMSRKSMWRRISVRGWLEVGAQYFISYTPVWLLNQPIYFYSRSYGRVPSDC